MLGDRFAKIRMLGNHFASIPNPYSAVGGLVNSRDWWIGLKEILFLLDTGIIMII